MVVEVIQHFQANEGHCVRLLRDRSGNYAFLNPIQRIGISVEGHNDFVLHTVIAEHSGYFFAGLRLQTDECVHFVFFLSNNRGCRIERNSRIALDIDHPHDFDLCILFQAVAISAQTLFHIGLARHCKYHYVALVLQFLDKALSSHQSCLVVVGSDEEQPLTQGRIGIHRNDRDSSADGAVNVILHQLGISHRNQDAGRLLLYGLLKRLLLGFGIIAVRTRELGPHLELGSGLHKTCSRRLPIRHLKVGGDEVILFISIVARSAT